MIPIVSDIDEIKRICGENRRQGKRIGLVPTMGAFHEGHLSLIRRAAAITGFVVVSIYINPKQFGENEDLDSYPRSLEYDVYDAEKAGANTVFAPDDLIIYPAGYLTYVNVEGLTEGLCGGARPGHFRGVTTVVAKLFNIVQPDVAVFGEKDAQQLAVIRAMVRDLNMDIDIDAGPIVRESDGLAMSSRNQYLSPDERAQASVLYESLRTAESLIDRGTTDTKVLTSEIKSVIDSASAAEIEYIEIVDMVNLKPVGDVSSDALIAIAVHFGTTRLIDNIVVKAGKS